MVYQPSFNYSEYKFLFANAKQVLWLTYSRILKIDYICNTSETSYFILTWLCIHTIIVKGMNCNYHPIVGRHIVIKGQ